MARCHFVIVYARCSTFGLKLSLEPHRAHCALFVAKVMASPSSDRAAKLKRFDRFRRAVPHLSVNALTRVLAKVADEGLPELRSRRHALEAQNAQLLKMTPYGPILRSIFVNGLRIYRTFHTNSRR